MSNVQACTVQMHVMYAISCFAHLKHSQHTASNTVVELPRNAGMRLQALRNCPTATIGVSGCKEQCVLLAQLGSAQASNAGFPRTCIPLYVLFSSPYCRQRAALSSLLHASAVFVFTAIVSHTARVPSAAATHAVRYVITIASNAIHPPETLFAYASAVKHRGPRNVILVHA